MAIEIPDRTGTGTATRETAVRADPWLRWAERVDAWRLMPRALMIIMYCHFIQGWYFVVEWFMHYDWSQVDNEAVALAIAGFPAIILGVLTGVLANLTKGYWEGGRKWDS